MKLMVAMAPECEFFEFRVNRDVTHWGDYVGRKDGRLTWKSPDGIMFTHQTGEHNLIDLVFYTKPEHGNNKIDSHCFLMAESLLGEDIVLNWIGYVDVESEKSNSFFNKLKSSKTPPNAPPVSALRETITSAIADTKNRLPKKPLYVVVEDHDWSLLTMEPQEQSDYKRMDDLLAMFVFGLGPHVSLYNGQTRFASERFSAVEETFIFIKMDGTADDLCLETVEDRGVIEDAVNAALNPQSLGGVIGGGTGMRYSYIFLAVTDLSLAIDNIKDALRGIKMTRRCWILFNDHMRE